MKSMSNERPIVIRRGSGRRQVAETILFPTDAVLADAATELRKASNGAKGTYGSYGFSCVGLYLPPRTCSSTEVDLFTGAQGATTTHPIDGSCTFYHFDGRLTMVAVVDTFETSPPTIRLLQRPATGIQMDLFAEVNDARVEGRQVEVTLTRSERDPSLRAMCIHHHGAACAACGMEFGATYGAIAEGFIHVHHLTPLAEVAQDHEVDPKTDLVPLCPNCHAVAHMRNPPYTQTELQDLLKHGHG